MLRTIDYTQLDPDTKAYLREVRRAKGRGAPGVFEVIPDARGGWALIIGLVILPLFLWLGYSTNKAPWAMAMLQTAGVMLGGWLILYAVRRWTAGPDRYAGRFVYFDPENVFVGRGEEVEYARLGEAASAEPAGDTAVKLDTEAGEFAVPVPNRTTALFVADYYDALAHLRKTEGWWDRQSPAVLGAAARYMVVNERVPASSSDVELDIDDLPDEVRPARRRPSGIPRYLLILAIGVGVFFAFRSTNRPLHDAAAFAGVDQTSPAELRHYLADPNTEAHHDAAKKKLNELYDAKMKALAGRGNDPELRDAFLQLLDTLRGPELPVLSLGVKDTTPNALGNWADTLRTRLADGIGGEVGKEYVLFVHKPDEPGKFGLMELTYTSEPAGGLKWTLDFRKSPTDAAPYKSVTHSVAVTTGTTSEAIYHDVMMKMLGNAPPAPVLLPADDW